MVESAANAWRRMSPAERAEVLDRVGVLDAEMFDLSSDEVGLLDAGGARAAWSRFPNRVQKAIAFRLTVDRGKPFVSDAAAGDTCPACASMVDVLESDPSWERMDRSDQRFVESMEGREKFSESETKRLAELFSANADREF